MANTTRGSVAPRAAVLRHTPSPEPPAKPSLHTRLRDGWPRALFIVGVLVHLLFLVSLRTGWLNPLFNDSMHRFGPGCDFFSIYAAGVKARLGESVYTIGGHVETVPYAYAFRYAPLVAYTLGLVLSLLPALAAYGLWLIVCELALLRNLRLTLERAPDPRTGYLAAALWLLFSPYYLELYVGQFTFVTASLMFWAYLAWQDHAAAPEGESRAKHEARRTVPEGASVEPEDGFWVAAVWLKMMPLLYLPIALLRGRWKSAVLLVLTLIVTSALYFAHFPQDWAEFALVNIDPLPTWHAGNQGLMALLYGALGERAGPFLRARLVVLALVGLSLLWLTYRAWMAQRRERAASHAGEPNGPELERSLTFLYAACTAAYLLTYKDVWEHHVVLLLPPLVLLALRRERLWLWVPPFLISALPSLFALYDLPGLGYNEDPQVYWRPAVSLLHHAWKPLGPLWLLVGLLARSVPAASGETRIGRALREDDAPPSLRAAVRVGRRLAPTAALLLLGACLVGIAGFARSAIRQQRQVTRQLLWPPDVFQKQQSVQTCGPAALAAVCRHYGVPATEPELAGLAGTTAQGTSMLGLRAAAQAKGLSAEGWQVTADRLRTVPRPCILFFQLGHFAVLTQVQGSRFYLADPSVGQHTWTKEQLMHVWRGQVLVVGPSEALKARQ